MRSTFVATLVGLLCAANAWAQQGDAPPRRGMFDGAAPVRQPPDDKEVLDFAKQRMPNLYRLVTEYRRPRLRGVARARYRAIKQAETRGDTDGLERLYKNVQNEDQVFAYILELDKAKPEDRPAIGEKIRVTMRSVFEDYLAQRAERIERLKERLEDEERQLEEERAQIDARIEQQLDRFDVNVGPATRESAEPPPGDTMASPERAQ